MPTPKRGCVLKSLFWAVEADWIAAAGRAVGAVHMGAVGAVY